MSQLILDFDSLSDLRMQLEGFGAGLPPSLSPANSLALYDDDELEAERMRRKGIVLTSNTPQAEPAPPAEPEAAAPAKKRGRPAKKEPEQPELFPEGQPITGEPPPNVVNIKQAKEPDKNADSVAPSLPTEDEMLALMSEVYSKSGDMELVRGVMQEVGGKTQLSQIPTAAWPALQKRLLEERARLTATGAA